MRQRGSQALTGVDSNACAATWFGRALAGGRLRILDADHLSFALKTPWSDGTRHLLMSPMELLERLAALAPRLGSISSVITGSWRPVSAIASCRPRGCRAVGRGRLSEHSILRPSAAVGDPAGEGVFLRPQRMRGLWRTTADRRRPDRSGLDPDLSGGGRDAGVGPGVSPCQGPA